MSNITGVTFAPVSRLPAVLYATGLAAEAAPGVAYTGMTPGDTLEQTWGPGVLPRVPGDPAWVTVAALGQGSPRGRGGWVVGGLRGLRGLPRCNPVKSV